MVIGIDKGKKVLSMKLMNIDSKEEMLLYEREGSSRCLFNEDILFGEYLITLRVDWGDIRNGDPVLDADIYKNISGRKKKKIRNGPWHHTKKEYDKHSNCLIYEFNFQKLILRLMSQTTFGIGVSMDAILVKREDNIA
ncbi:MAG: hypothetical protein JRC90_05665 [Deltaproteobacteria bacterium]|nr:hypothetical protein [Deltaproteobacteria bacterium]